MLTGSLLHAHIGYFEIAQRGDLHFLLGVLFYAKACSGKSQHHSTCRFFARHLFHHKQMLFSFGRVGPVYLQCFAILLCRQHFFNSLVFCKVSREKSALDFLAFQICFDIWLYVFNGHFKILRYHLQGVFKCFECFGHFGQLGKLKLDFVNLTRHQSCFGFELNRAPVKPNRGAFYGRANIKKFYSGFISY